MRDASGIHEKIDYASSVAVPTNEKRCRREAWQVVTSTVQ
jgi:hypothetical protein